MNRNEVIERLCILCSEVGEKVFNHEYSHDCFCCNTDEKNFQLSIIIINFIENAVKEKIEELNKVKGLNMKKDKKKRKRKEIKTPKNARYTFCYDYPLFIIQENKTTLTWTFEPMELIRGQLIYDRIKSDRFYKFPIYVKSGIWDLYYQKEKSREKDI